MESFIEGFILGLGAAIPLGPINILIMNNAIRKYSNGVAIGVGAMSADAVYLILILVGIVGFLNNIIILNILGILGVLFLGYLSIIIYKNRNNEIKLHNEKTQSNIFKKYLQGFFLTLLNPYTIAFWISIGSYIVTKELHIFLTIFGMICAITAWITLMPYFVHKTKHKISQKVSYTISIISAVILLGFAFSLLIKLIYEI